MEVKVNLRVLIIKDKETGKEFIVRTLRTAEEVAGYVEESEKDEVVSKLEEVVYEAYGGDDLAF